MLYILPTPIGNLEDMTPRALKALGAVDAVYCEDTRRTRALMTHFGLAKPLRRYDDRREEDARGLLERLTRGENLALVSDGGLPCVSDPGLRAVSLARQAGLAVTALPGANAATAALAGSGLPADSFVFLGFLARAPGKRRRAISEAAVLEKTLVIYESPFRVTQLLEEAQDVLGPLTQTCVVRELSKIHEEWLWGDLADVLELLKSRERLLGEFVVMFHPRPRPSEEPAA